MRGISAFRAFGPATVGVLVAHQIAYAGHDDGHLHGYLEVGGPAVAIAASIAWLGTVIAHRIAFRDVLKLQAFMLVVMELTERWAAGMALAPSDVMLVGASLALLPVLGGFVIGLRGVARIPASSPVLVFSVRAVSALWSGQEGQANTATHNLRLIRGPPRLV